MPTLYAAPAHTADPIAISINEAARLAGVGRTRIYQALGYGELPSIKLGRRRLIRVAAVEAWLAKHEAG